MALLGLCAAALLTACGEKEGDECKPGALHCLDEKHALSCDKGKLIKVLCEGKAGCKENEEKKQIVCDVSSNKAGSACSSSLEGIGSCSEDKTQLVLCQKGKFLELPCRGKKGCKTEKGAFVCDQTLALEDDTCNEKTGSACAVDGKSRLSCVDGEMKKDIDCLGKKGCRLEKEKVLCDMTLARKGRKCLGEGAACSVSGEAVLRCQNGKFVVAKKCKAGCRVLAGADKKPGKVTCPQEAGTPAP